MNKENESLETEKMKLNKTSKDISNSEEISLIFRNQLSSDTLIKLSKTKLSSFNISDIVDILFLKLNKSKQDSYIRLFFKGRPLNQEEKMKDLCKK